MTSSDVVAVWYDEVGVALQLGPLEVADSMVGPVSKAPYPPGACIARTQFSPKGCVRIGGVHW